MHGVDVILISFIVSSSHELYDGSMGRQKSTLLLCLFLGEQEHIFSHTLHDVAGGGDGIISLSFYDREVLPPWEELLMYCSIMGDIFDKGHVKEWSYDLARDYLQRPTTLSFESLGLLMEYPQDHVPRGQRGGEIDGVVDGDIY